MNKFTLGVAALAMAIPAVAQSQAPGQNAQRMNNVQTRDQAVAKVREHFARIDVNRDGFIAGAEMQSLRGQGKRNMAGRRARANGGANPAAAFDRLDANRDGMISRAEFGAARELRSQRQLARKNTPGARMGGGRKGGGMMRMADLDRDGRVSLQEATNGALQRFDRIDANRDGTITPDERRTTREQRKAARGQRAG
jgi:Ca2+-binding EF-hand superfamily protein